MSYILEALRKAEAERSRGAGVSLIGHGPPKSRGPLIYAVVGLLAANAGLLVWWGWDSAFETRIKNPITLSVPGRETAPPHPRGTSGAGVPFESRVNTEVTIKPPSAVQPAPTTSLRVERRDAEPDITWIETAAPRLRTTLADMPSLDRAGFPVLEFTTHIYADDADLRAVVVNGIRYREGENFGPETTLVHITETGVEVLYRDYAVELRVLQEWE
ncbi:MAG: general secretion pathway protein GspB [Gammaproteobacteria bacterium]|nr:general secretion pathway protein GspB [Gammaproteobacteria bacterium]